MKLDRIENGTQGSLFLAMLRKGLCNFSEGIKFKVNWKITFDCSGLATTESIAKNRLEMLESGIHSDVTFEVGGQMIKAHKCILVSQSEYFRAMFDSGMMESRTNVVTIKDFVPEVFKEALRFIYTGQLKENFNAIRLLPLAEMYQLPDLKQVCLDPMMKNLRIENAPEVLALAVQLNETELKAASFAFLKTVSEKERWETLNAFDEDLRDEFLASL